MCNVTWSVTWNGMQNSSSSSVDTRCITTVVALLKPTSIFSAGTGGRHHSCVCVTRTVVTVVVASRHELTRCARRAAAAVPSSTSKSILMDAGGKAKLLYAKFINEVTVAEPSRNRHVTVASPPSGKRRCANAALVKRDHRRVTDVSPSSPNRYVTDA